MRLQFIIVFFSLICGIQISAQNSIDNAIKGLLAKPEYKNASVGICVKNMETEEIQYALNSDKLLIPASTMKLVTTASALEILGDDFRFETKIGYIGETEKNLLKGDLVLIGGADPTLGSVHFQDHYFEFLMHWARKIKLSGITKIEGDLILDASIYDSEKVPATWIWEDIGNYYGAGANAFTLYDNLFQITFKSPKRAGKPAKIISIYPEIQGLEVRNLVQSSDLNSDNAYVYGSPLDKKREIRGTIPKNRKMFSIKAAIHHPEELLANELLQVFSKEGIFIDGEIKFDKVNRKKFREIYTQQSPPLSEIVKMINYKSVNLFSEHLVKQIAVENGFTGNREKGIEIIKNFWQDKKINMENIFVEDGSGLSHFNAVTPGFFVQLLSEMKGNTTFRNSLPGAGEGTIYHFNKSNFSGNSLKAKSGSMTRVRCYAGYLTTDSGNELAFSIMVNHFNGTHSALINEIEKILIEIKK